MINERELKIINFLKDKNHHITGNEIRSIIGVSSKTLREDIKNINRRLKRISSEISCVKGKGYILELRDKDKFNDELIRLYEESIDNDILIPTTSKGRVVYIIKKLLLLELKHNKGITHNSLCDDLYVGLTTLKADLVEVKRKLKRFDIELSRDGVKGIALRGSEENIRSCMSYYVFRRFENDIINLMHIDNVFIKEDIEKIENILSSVMTKNEISITDISFYNLLIHILIAIKRVKNKNIISTTQYAEELKETIEYKVAKQLANTILEEYKISLPKEEVFYMTQQLYTRKVINDEESKRKVDLNSDYTLMVCEMLKYVDYIVGLDFCEDQILIWSLSIHLKSAITRIRYDMHITNDMLNEIKKNYSFAYKIASIATQYIEKKVNKFVNEDEIGFICLHFAAALQRIKNGRKINILKAIIVCASGIGTSMIMSEKIKSEFPNSIEIIEVIPLHSLSKIDKNSYDIIISTIKIDIKEYQVEDKKIMYVSPIIKTKEVSALKEVINKTKEDYLLKFLEFTDENLFFADENLKTKEEILEFMLDKMVSKEYLTESEKESFYKRENMSSTEIGNQIAIPHSIDIDPCISKVCILINRKSILWEEEKVRLVILMSIQKGIYLEFGEILENLYMVLSDEEKISKILNVKTYNEFIKLLR